MSSQREGWGARAMAWTDRLGGRSGSEIDGWGHKTVAWTDKLGNKLNSYAAKQFGAEPFWPTTGDFPRELDKAVRILRAFTIDGVEGKHTKHTRGEEDYDDDTARHSENLRYIIPPQVIADANGLAIFTCLRSGITPFGGSGGAGVVVARLPDDSWSAPASVMLSKFQAGLILGLDVFDCVMVMRTAEAMECFSGTRMAIGVDFNIMAGPWCTNEERAGDIRLNPAPVYAYIRSKGAYAGVEIAETVFTSRTEENEQFYNHNGITPAQILTGEVPMPSLANKLVDTITQAEAGTVSHRAAVNAAKTAHALQPDDGTAGGAQAAEQAVPSAPSVSTSGGQFTGLAHGGPAAPVI